MAKSEAEKALDQITKFKVNVTQREFLESDRKTKYKKWQMRAAKLIGVDVADNFDYCYRVMYKSSLGRLKANDVILSNESRSFFVMKELNGIAIIVTSEPSTKEPFVHGSFRVIDKPKV